MDQVEDICHGYQDELRLRKENKINNLLAREEAVCSRKGKQTNVEFNFYPRVINCSSVHFEKEELGFLEKGLKHSIPPLRKEEAIQNLIVDVETQLCFKNELVSQCATLIQSTPVEEADHRTKTTVKGIKKKVTENELIVTKADKGQSIVIMAKSDYDGKLKQFLENSGAQLPSISNKTLESSLMAVNTSSERKNKRIKY